MSAKTESEADSKRYRDDDTREEGLNERRCDIELIERREDREGPDRIARDFPDESGSVEVRSLRRTAYDTLRRIGDNRSDEQDEDGDDHLREIAEDDIPDEDVDRIKMQDAERRDEEDDNEEPLDEEAEEFSGRKLETGAREQPLDACRTERLVDAERVDDLRDDATEPHTNEPSDDEDNDRDDYVRDERYQSVKEALERLAQNICPCGENHND